MKTIIAATDFSASARNAAQYAAQMALTINADLLLLHTYQIPVSFGEVPFAVNFKDLQREAEENLNSLKEELTKQTGNKINIETRVAEASFFSELNTACTEVKPYAVILGSQGTSAAERFFFGSKTVYAARHLNWPVITVPPNVSFNRIKKIGLSCDFEKVIDTIPVDEIKELVKDFGAELHILNTGKTKDFSPELVFESGLLQEMIASLKPEYHFLTSDTIEEGILDFAEKNKIDLLLVVPKFHLLPEKLVTKSNTRQFVLHSHVPVMALHA